MSFLLWKMQSKMSSAYSIVGINALKVRKVQMMVTSVSLQIDVEKSICTHGTVRPPFLSYRGVSVSVSLPISVCFWGWKQCLPVSTPYALLKVSSNSCVVHTPRWSIEWARMQAPPMYPAGCPQDTLVRAALQSAPLALLCFTHPCSCRFLQMCLVYAST